MIKILTLIIYTNNYYDKHIKDKNYLQQLDYYLDNKEKDVCIEVSLDKVSIVLDSILSEKIKTYPILKECNINFLKFEVVEENKDVILHPIFDLVFKPDTHNFYMYNTFKPKLCILENYTFSKLFDKIAFHFAIVTEIKKIKGGK
jgi:hypothetical protein